MRRCVVHFHATPFRGDRFEEVWESMARRTIRYGALSFSFARSDDDRLHFTLASDWEDPEDFERFWDSPEAREARAQTSSFYALPVVPHWEDVVVQGVR